MDLIFVQEIETLYLLLNEGLKNEEACFIIDLQSKKPCVLQYIFIMTKINYYVYQGEGGFK